MSSAALLGGEWVAVGAVRRWRPVLAVVPDPKPPLDLSTLIACPTCRAKVTEVCRTSGGNRRTPHESRLAPRLCVCGELPRRHQHYCNDCCREAELRRKRRYINRVRRVAQMAPEPAPLSGKLALSQVEFEAQSGPESARTDRGLRPVPAKES